MTLDINIPKNGEGLWAPKAKDRRAVGMANVNTFKDIMRSFPQLRFFWPNYMMSPWHVQTRIGDEKLNFWPHVLKANVSGSLSVEGAMRIRFLIENELKNDDIILIE